MHLYESCRYPCVSTGVEANMSKGRTIAMAASIRFVHPLLASIRKYARISVGSIALLLLAIGMVFCNPASAQSTTTISGTVFMPNGTNVLSNVLVYVTTGTVAAPVSGADCPSGPGCITAANAVPSGITLFTFTAVDGTFTLGNVPVSASYNLVIQAGKWQREFEAVEVGTTALSGLQLAMPTAHGTFTGSITSAQPGSQSSGTVMTVNSIPLIALSTGAVDAVECVFRDVGIASTEFTDDSVVSGAPSFGGRIHLYKGDFKPGAEISPSTPSETTLMTNTTLLNSYDMAMFPCQGSTTAESSTNVENLIAYSSAGGRVFATHDSRVWLNNPPPTGASFAGAATWLASPVSTLTPDPGVAIVNTGFTDGSTLSQWLFNGGYSDGNTAGGADTGTAGEVEISTLRWDLMGVTAPTQSWLTMNSSEGAASGAIMQMTFNTPVGADLDAQFGRVLFSDYHVEAVTNSAGQIFPAECPTLNETDIAQEKMLEYALFDLSNFVTAVIAPTASISIATDPANGQFKEGDTTDTITATVLNTSSSNPLPANTTFTMTLPPGVTATAMTDSTAGGGWICTVGTLTCTRTTPLALSTSDAVTVTVSVSSTATGGEPTSSGVVTAQVASANFSSNLSSPITITLVEAAAVSWATPAPITFGTALSATQLDAVGNAPTGTYVYTPAVGYVPPSVGPLTLSVMYTPTSDTNTFTGTGMGSVTLMVIPAPVTVVLGGLTESFTGSPAMVTATTSPTTATPVTFTFTYTGTGTTVYEPSSTPPTADGTYTVVATIASGQNYSGTATGTLVISGLATLDTTTTTVQANPNPVMAGQPVTITATIADVTTPLTIPTGSVIFTDTTTSTVLNGGTAVNLNNGVATLTGVVLSGGGMHTITAVYSGVTGFIAGSTNTASEQVGLSSAIGTPISGYPVTVTITGDGTPANISVLTEGAPNLDFTNAVTGDTCVTSPPDIGGTCTVSVNFAPEFAGPRYGAVVITDSGGDVLGTAYLQGTGTGPQMAFAPGTQIALPNSAAGVALGNVGYVRTDESRNVYIADFSNFRIVKTPWTGTGYGTPIAIPLTGQDFNYANGMAVDGAGNLLVITYAELVELPWNGSTYGDPVVLIDGLNPGGVAVDGAGNVYASDYFANTVTEVPRTANGYGEPTVLFNQMNAGLNSPRGLFVDGTGNVYVANTNANAVVEMPWTGSGYGAPVTIGSGLTTPTDVGVDAAGDVYIADAGNARAVMVPLTSNGFGAQTVEPFGPIGLSTLAVDELGNVFANNDSTVTEVNVSTPVSLSFASTSLGATSSDSPKTVTVMNDGNAPLTFTSLTYPTDFPEVSEAEGACSVSAPLAAGTGCTLPVDFTPATTTIPGALSENLVLVDNNMNATVAPANTQALVMNGTALAGVTATVLAPTTTLTAGHAASFTPVSGAGGTAPLMYSVSPGLPAGLTFNTDTGAITGTPTAASAAATYTVTVTDANGATAMAAFSLTADGAIAATVSAASTVQTVYQSMSGLTPVSGSGGAGPLMFSISPGLPAGLVFNPNTGAITGTPTAVSAATTYTVTVTDANGATATAMFSMTVAQQPSQTVVSASPMTATAGQAVTLTATVAATVAGTPVMPTGTVTFFDNGMQLGAAVNLVNGVATLNVASLPTGTAVITAVYSGDGNFLTSTSNNDSVGVLDFTFTNTGTAAYTAAPGAVATYNFALAPLNSGGYPGQVNFTVTGLPAGAVASFTPSSVAADGGAVPVTMTVQTAAPMAHNENHGNSPLGRGVMLALLLLPFGMKRKLREKLRGRMLLLVLLLAGTTAAMSGCASNNGFMLQSPGTYTLTVTATSGNLQHSQIVTLIVQ